MLKYILFAGSAFSRQSRAVADGDRSLKMYYTYVLRSIKYGILYTGSTNDLQRRLVEHNSGLSKYTKSTAPYELIYKEEFKTKSEAYQREMFFKSGKGREFIKSILHSRE